MMLQLKDLDVNIAGAVVLRSIDFSLAEGEALLIVGRNGAGKTTTLRTVMGLVAPERGSITIGDIDMAHKPPHLRAAWGIGYAPEDRGMIGPFNVEDNILLPGYALGYKREMMRERLELVYDILPELTGLRLRKSAGLSGGQGKMVALGRALFVSTRVLLLDEPFQGLTPLLSHQYAVGLHRLKAKLPNLGILVTESSPQYLDGIADRTAVIDRGTIVSDKG
jgi:branched-chain amino acid transport system ATP-binding protein